MKKHFLIREELIKMQKMGGAAIIPLSLIRAIDLYKKEAGMPPYNCYTIAYTLCIMCNEYYLYCCHEKNPKDEFFIPQERWDRYYIMPHGVQMGVDYLTQMGLIHVTKKQDPRNPDATIDVYSIDLKQLEFMRSLAEQMYEQEHGKKFKFLN